MMAWENYKAKYVDIDKATLCKQMASALMNFTPVPPISVQAHEWRSRLIREAWIARN
jgi:hypothetical protein